ncbi:hypothetical protein LAZ67_14001664 [Cordylochernes scorpioides]|uniref:Mos1 transposase HTH domain-containing protein n=1 Tax=Cordylochernes scorpioides TaxID=51811 RepID=A0ABY6L7B5_9ARAC|nr:hypothetical protein LAZ67_14001664 [Cordylochernes scorpioides]
MDQTTHTLHIWWNAKPPLTPGWLKHAMVRCKTRHRRESRLKSLPNRNLVQHYKLNLNSVTNANISYKLICDTKPNMNTRIRQPSVTEFPFKSGDISATTIHSKLQPVYGNEKLDRSTIQIWVQRFQKGDFDLPDKERPVGEAALSQSKTFKWFARFKSGRESTQDNARQGRPPSENHEELTQNIML